MKINLATYLVFTDGVLDTEATIDKFQTDMLEYYTSVVEKAEQIESALHSIFDDPKYKIARMQKPFIEGEIMRRLDVSHSNWGEMSLKVKLVLQDLKDRGVIEVPKGQGSYVKRLLKPGPIVETPETIA